MELNIHYSNLQKEARARIAVDGKAEPDSAEAKLAARFNDLSGEDKVLAVYKGLGGAYVTGIEAVQVKKKVKEAEKAAREVSVKRRNASKT